MLTQRCHRSSSRPVRGQGLGCPRTKAEGWLEALRSPSVPVAIGGWVCAWVRQSVGPGTGQRGAPAPGRAGFGLDTCSMGSLLMASYPFLISLTGQPFRGTLSLLRCANTSHSCSGRAQPSHPKSFRKSPRVASGLVLSGGPCPASQPCPVPGSRFRRRAGRGVGVSCESTRPSRTW